MHILNNENKGTRGATPWKTFGKCRENIKHKFSRARAKRGEFLEVGIKGCMGKAVGFWSILRTKDVYRLQVLAGGIWRQEENRITSELRLVE